MWSTEVLFSSCVCYVGSHLLLYVHRSRMDEHTFFRTLTYWGPSNPEGGCLDEESLCASGGSVWSLWTFLKGCAYPYSMRMIGLLLWGRKHQVLSTFCFRTHNPIPSKRRMAKLVWIECPSMHELGSSCLENPFNPWILLPNVLRSAQASQAGPLSKRIASLECLNFALPISRNSGRFAWCLVILSR